MNTAYLRSTMLAAGFLALPIWAKAQSPSVGSLSVDLRAGTMNSKPLAAWTLEEVTDSLGRPTAVIAGVSGIVGVQLHYHLLGVSFWFQPKNKDPDQHLWILSLYLARSWDSRSTAWFAPFSGSISPAVDANWKEARILAQFHDFDPVLQTAAQREAEMERAVGKLAIQVPEADVVRYKLSGVSVAFLFEPNTGFVERVTLQAADSAR